MSDASTELLHCSTALEEAANILRGLAELPRLAELYDAAAKRAKEAAAAEAVRQSECLVKKDYATVEGVARRATIGELHGLLADAYGALLTARLQYGLSKAMGLIPGEIENLREVTAAIDAIESYRQKRDPGGKPDEIA